MMLRPIHFLLAFLTQSAWSYNILLMCPFPAPSHWLWIEVFARELVNRGHHVTAITNHRTKEPHQNYTEIIIDPMFDIPAIFPKKDLFALKFNSDFHNLFMWWKIGPLTSEHALNDTKVKAIINSTERKYDLFIVEQFFHESFLMFAHKFKIPIVTLGTFGYSDNMDRAMGLITPWSFVPHIVVPFRDTMNFWQRSYNALLSAFDLLMRRIYYLPIQQDIANRYFHSIADKAGRLPSVLDLERNISLMLINSHRSTNEPRPSMPGLINVGGVHIKPIKPLPRDIQEFLDGAANGAIYFSLGSYVKSTEMPKDKLAIILNVFKNLKYRVLWKYEDNSIGKLPENIMVRKWMPQNDVLAHKNLVLFITHGGIFGTQEGIYHGTPMLYMPLFGDQHRNSLRSQEDGYALTISFKDITVDNLTNGIETILNNTKYTKRAREMSVLFRDNPMHPLDESMYWIEYIARHKGARHLKSNAVNMTWYQYLLLDVIAFYASCAFIVLYISYKLLRVLIDLTVGNVQQDVQKKKIS